MIQVSSLGKEFASRILFQNMTFSINKNERVGLVGRNGTGKSTLLKILVGDISADEGEVSFPKNYSFELLKQHIDFSQNTVLAECMQVLPKEQHHDFYLAEKILFGLGFEKEDLQKEPRSFSGGYQIRITLTKCLLKTPDMLLLDEPTNYLDIVSLRWLEQFLRKYPGELILITHDREFMNRVCTHTMGIHRNKLIKVKGDYSKYWEKIQEDEKIYENTRINQEKKKKDLEDFINKFRAKARQASLAQSRQKMLEKMEEFDRLEDVRSINFTFNYSDFPAKTMLEVHNLSFGYNHPLFEHLSFYVNKGDKIAIIGKNGKGKSTLLNLLGDQLTPQQGSISCHGLTKRGHFAQTHINTLHENHTVEQEILSANSELGVTQVRNICGSMMFSGDDATKAISVLSGGEKSRVLLGKILAQETNLLLLDEPTNHLDQESIEVLVEELKRFQGAVIIVTHSESILRKLATKFIIFHHHKCEEFIGSYDDFLQKIGWEEQVPSNLFVENAEPKLTHKEKKHLRSELIKERSKMTKPLKEKLEKLEAQISQWEDLETHANQGLITASEKNDGDAIEKFSKQLNEAQSQIEISFELLEQVSEELQKIENEFEIKLSPL